MTFVQCFRHMCVVRIQHSATIRHLDHAQFVFSCKLTPKHWTNYSNNENLCCQLTVESIIYTFELPALIVYLKLLEFQFENTLYVYLTNDFDPRGDPKSSFRFICLFTSGSTNSN
jgi:hypothetical protein